MSPCARTTRPRPDRPWLPLIAPAALVLLSSCGAGSTSALGTACAAYYGGCCEEVAGGVGLSCAEQRAALEREIAQGRSASELEPACAASLDAARMVGACDGTTGPRDGGGDGSNAGQTALCNRYVECTARVTPAGLAAVAAAYGPAGVCFATLGIDRCDEACREGLTQLRTLAGSAGLPECAECAADAECADASRPVCSTAGTCVECTADAQCHGSRPACDLGSRSCVACTRDDHCPSAAPACLVSERRCVACTSASHCSGATPSCQTSTHTCTACQTDADCPSDRPACSSTGAGPVCVECTADHHCQTPGVAHCVQSFETPFRPELWNRCVPCVTDEDCATGGVCDFATLQCHTITCAELDATCGAPSFRGLTLACGGCTGAMTCQQHTGDHEGYRCGLPRGTACDPRQPLTCGEWLRCVWYFLASVDVGFCATDVTGAACTSNTYCAYALGTSQLGGVCNQDTCMPRCAVDEHCGPSGTCVSGVCAM